ncbi:hypothetical protein HOY82DRAFT_617821 [Tuber indicum]|nr:hypothetical protein HOY82DRAFT_617821 [Tuber indicum]
MLKVAAMVVITLGPAIWTRGENLDNRYNDRIINLEKDYGDFKAVTNKTIGGLETIIEKEFGKLHAEILVAHGTLNAQLSDTRGILRTEIEKTRGDLTAEIRPKVWQVRVLLAGVTLFTSFLAQTYFFPNVFSNGKQTSPAERADDPRPDIHNPPATAEPPPPVASGPVHAG